MKPWIEYEGAFYHVIFNCNSSESVFLFDKDKERFLDKLKEYKRRSEYILLHLNKF